MKKRKGPWEGEKTKRGLSCAFSIPQSFACKVSSIGRRLLGGHKMTSYARPTKIKNGDLNVFNKPFQGFLFFLFFFFLSTFDEGKLGEIRRHQWKERPKISKIAKFESELLKTNRYSFSKSRNFTDVCMVGGTNLPPLPPPPASCKRLQTLLNYIFARVRRFTFRFSNFTNFKALIPVQSRDFP